MPLVSLGAPAGRSRWTVSHPGGDLLVLARGEGYVVTDALCPHRQQPLVEGIERAGALVCPGHWYAFDLATGACRTGGGHTLRLHPVIDRDDGLWADVPEAPPSQTWSERLRAHAAAAHHDTGPEGDR